MSDRHFRLTAGSQRATESDLRAVQRRDRLLRAELPRVREAATAWRNGLAGLLAALIGFGLVKGRSDVGQLAARWAVAVGVLLAAALLVGAAGALLLLRAAHGRPDATAARDLLSASVADHVEATNSVRALKWGIRATLGCTLLLIVAVGFTWYGPEKAKPAVQVTTPTGTLCGTVVRLSQDTLVLKTKAGEVSTDMSAALTLQAVGSCP
ncbi:hypothetical protein [Actinomadura bangladeshensis]|uniref:hypothetical protein n=1 Tax=Actinomadura bangladeshensis TaxID=453573 RepID=UPI001EF3AC09|nr:hypothetical protein [Actinomadura bangladeshensis]